MKRLLKNLILISLTTPNLVFAVTSDRADSANYGSGSKGGSKSGESTGNSAGNGTGGGSEIGQSPRAESANYTTSKPGFQGNSSAGQNQSQGTSQSGRSFETISTYRTDARAFSMKTSALQDIAEAKKKTKKGKSKSSKPAAPPPPDISSAIGAGGVF